jgi:hypothetical protein
MHRPRFALPGFAVHPLTLALLALVLVQACLYAAGLFARCDTLQAYAFFNYSLGNMLAQGEFPQWLPNAALGSPAEPYSLVFLGPFQIVLVLLGGLLGLGQAWGLFFFGAVLELAVFVTGVWLLGREIYASRLAAAAVTFCAVALAYWHVQIFWPHRIIVFFPLLLYCLLRFHRSGDLVHLWQGAAVGVLMLVGSVVYTAPIYLMCCLVLYAGLCLFSRARPRLDPATAFSARGLVSAGMFAALALAFFWLLAHAFDGVLTFAPERDPVTRTVTLDVFLNYGGRAAGKLPEFFLGTPLQDTEVYCYLGVAACALILLALWKARGPVFSALLCLTAFVFLLSLGPHGGVAYAAYHFPLARYFRHLPQLLPLARLLGLFLAGFGLDVLAASGEGNGLRRWSCCLATSAGLFLVLKWLVLDPPPVAVWTRFLPEISLAALGIATAVPWFNRKSAVRFLAWLPAAVMVLELAAAQSVLFASPLNFAPGGRLASPRVDVFAAQRPVFRPGRMADTAAEPGWEALVNLAVRHRVSNATLYLLTGVDPCVPVFRVDYATPAAYRLLAEVSPGSLAATNRELDLGRQLSASHWLPALLDPEYRRLAGCGGGKLVLDPDGPNPVDVSPGVRHFSANRLAVGVVQTGPVGRLLYSDAFHPGWSARLDGSPVPVEPAGRAFKAVTVPQGRHVVEFVFFDPLKEWARRALGVVAVAALGWFVFRGLRAGGPA